MRKATLSFVLLAVLGYLGLCGAVFALQRSLIYLPQARALAADQHSQWLQVDQARLQISVRELPGAPALLYFGGNAEDVSLSLDELSAAFPDHALYLPHYRGYGASEGEPSEAALFADALAVHAHIAARHPRVRVIGRSLGSGVAVYLASHRAIEQLVLITPYDSIAALAAAQFPYLPVDWLLRDRFDSLVYAPQVNAPTRILLAERDTLIPAANSRRLHEAFAQGRAQLQVLRGVGHNSIGQHPDYLRLLAAPAQ